MRNKLFLINRRALSYLNSFKSGYIKPELGDNKPTHIIIGAGSAGCVLVISLFFVIF